MKTHRTVSILLLAILGSVPAAHAQTGATVEDFRAIAGKIIVESKVFPALRDPSHQARESSPEPSIALLASNDGTVAKARFGYLVADLVSLNALVSGPVRGGSASLANEAGLGKGAAFEGQLKVVLRRSQSGNPIRSAFLLRSNSAHLEQLGLAQRGAAVEPSLDALVDAALRIAKGIEESGGARLVRSAARASPDALLGLPAVVAAASRSAASVAPELDSQEGRDAFAMAFRYLANDLNLWSVHRTWLLTLSARRGRPTFPVADVDGRTFTQVTENTSGGSAALGVVISRTKAKTKQDFYLGASYEREEGFSGSARNLCLPIGTAGALVCQNALASSPKGFTTSLWSADVRWYFDKGTKALAVRPSYERTTRLKSIEFPLYLFLNSKDLKSALTDDKAGLTGGLNVGWRKSPADDRAQFFALFFVGSIFNIPGVPR